MGHSQAAKHKWLGTRLPGAGVVALSFSSSEALAK